MRQSLRQLTLRGRRSSPSACAPPTPLAASRTGLLAERAPATQRVALSNQAANPFRIARGLLEVRPDLRDRRSPAVRGDRRTDPGAADCVPVPTAPRPAPVFRRSCRVVVQGWPRPNFGVTA